LTLLGACFFGYFFFVAVDKEKVTFQPQMLWCNNLPIKQRRRLFPSALPQGMLLVHFLLAVQKKVNMRFYFLSGRSERKCEGFPLGLARGRLSRSAISHSITFIITFLLL